MSKFVFVIRVQLGAEADTMRRLALQSYFVIVNPVVAQFSCEVRVNKEKMSGKRSMVQIYRIFVPVTTIMQKCVSIEYPKPHDFR